MKLPIKSTLQEMARGAFHLEKMRIAEIDKFSLRVRYDTKTQNYNVAFLFMLADGSLMEFVEPYADFPSETFLTKIAMVS